MFGSMGYCRVTQSGSVWVVSTPASGVPVTRLIGIAGEGVDCKLGTSGGSTVVTFFAGRIPLPGETVSVTYRRVARSIARLEDAASVAAEAAGWGEWDGAVAWAGGEPAGKEFGGLRERGDGDSELFDGATAAAISGSYAAEVCAAVGRGRLPGATSGRGMCLR